jgi:hypothetical protein
MEIDVQSIYEQTRSYLIILKKYLFVMIVVNNKSTVSRDLTYSLI